MKTTIYLILIFLCCYNIAQSQIAITGKVIDEGLVELPGVNIYDKDTTLLATTGWQGNFEVKVPENTKELILAGIGTEWKKISIPYNCNFLEVIMLNDGTYDYTSSSKIDRLRKGLIRFPKSTETQYKKAYFEKNLASRKNFHLLSLNWIKSQRKIKSLGKGLKPNLKDLK